MFNLLVFSQNKMPGESLLAKQWFEPGNHDCGISYMTKVTACSKHTCLLGIEGPEMPLYDEPIRERSSRSCSERRRKARKPATEGVKFAERTNQRSNAHPLADMAPRKEATRRAIDFIYVRGILKCLAAA